MRKRRIRKRNRNKNRNKNQIKKSKSRKLQNPRRIQKKSWLQLAKVPQRTINQELNLEMELQRKLKEKKMIMVNSQRTLKLQTM